MITVAVRTSSYLEVSVHDQDPGPPRPRQADTWDGSGRGLHLLEGLSDSWGTVAAPSGKWVWFRITFPTHEDQG